MDYKIGDVYKNEAFPNRVSTIIDISPKVDYDGGLSCFVMDNTNGEIAFSVEYEMQLKEWCEKINSELPKYESLSKEELQRLAKYQIGETYLHTESPDLRYTMVSVSPVKDFQNRLSYFCEVQDNSGDIWYDVHCERDMDRVLKKVD
ncbi:hypothetical protein O0Q50_23670 [Priestia aryabhattai]|uniref:Uncharacterized protein n=1 Tax=Priestia aryabhattai TaxID=412384 RepID=A0AAX6NE61_PRIAR|nr:hypothetical protein [Priestia aryabhattai]MDU9694188.1 hypothetical protein [Priestia aryabhattai]